MTVEKADFSALIERIHVKHQESLADPLRQAEIARGVAAEQREQRRAAIKALDRSMAERGVPAEEPLRAICLVDELSVTAAQVPAMQAVAQAEQWTRGKGREGFVLVLAGAPGCGKSCAVARWVARSSESALYVRSSTIAATPRDDWRENRALWERWANVRRLAIDEFGLEEPRTIGARLNALLCERFDNGNATVIATNLDETAVVDALFDARLASRVLGSQGRGGQGGGLPFFVSLPVGDLRMPEVSHG